MSLGIIARRTIFALLVLFVAASATTVGLPSVNAFPTTFHTFTFSYSFPTATWTVTKVKCTGTSCSPTPPNDEVKLQASGVGSSGDTFSAASPFYSVGQSTGQIDISLSVSFTTAQIGETFTSNAVLTCNTVTPDCGELASSFTV